MGWAIYLVMEKRGPDADRSMQHSASVAERPKAAL